ncbi:MAG: hypothetical protein JST28_14925 [Acidobacteria bacterium]|nr:hypothetical protein [Acidobacteriota bacterium]
MKRWLQKRGVALVLLIGVIVPPLVAWNAVKSDWRFWIAYSVVLFATAVLILSRAVDEVWALFHRR